MRNKPIIGHCALFIILFFTSLSASLAKESGSCPAPKVKVLLGKLKEEVSIEVRGRYQLYNPKTEGLIGSYGKRRKGKVSVGSGGIYFGKEYPGLSELRIVPNSPDCTIAVAGIPYRGTIEVYGVGGKISIVNEVEIDQYLRSVLGSKIKEELSQEALDALAITERTFLYHLIEKNAFASWHLEADGANYLGIASEGKPAIHAAIERTKNLALSWEGRPFATTWSLDSAGHSVSYSSIFRKRLDGPAGISHLPSSQLREKSKWTTSISIKHLAGKLGLETIDGIDLFRAEKTSKTYAVRFFSGRSSQDIDFFALQQIVGEKKLLSNDFSAKILGNKIEFVGHGAGSGVGLCLKSAQILANRGEKALSILKTHFPEAELIRIDSHS